LRLVTDPEFRAVKGNALAQPFPLVSAFVSTVWSPRRTVPVAVADVVRDGLVVLRAGAVALWTTPAGAVVGS
jgi:hypothetical protein